MLPKDLLIENILDLEWEMFRSVRARYPVSCQQNPKAFHLHRATQFSIWSDDVLNSYLNDLIRAKEQGINLMTIKYARMENAIPVVNNNPLIHDIVEMELDAQREMSMRYPNLLGRGRPLDQDNNAETSFKTYLIGELETYSDRTLELLHRNYLQLKQKGVNWSLQIYDLLVKKYGYTSLDQAEEAMRQKSAPSGAD